MDSNQMATSYHLNQRSLTINEILWHSSQGKLYLNTQDINPQVVYEIQPFEITSALPRKNELNHLDGLMQERRNSIANALELRLSYTNPSILSYMYQQLFYHMFL